jgi:manganese transport protein
MNLLFRAFSRSQNFACRQGIGAILTLPVVYVVCLIIGRKRGYATLERYLLAISTVLIISYGGSLLLRGLPLVREYMLFSWSCESSFLYMLAATTGAVVMPFMLFYQASATGQKSVRSTWSMRLETMTGAVASEVGAVVMLLATIGLNGFRLEPVLPENSHLFCL